jgi:YidC/Oxa1 family membrane protein insertase
MTQMDPKRLGLAIGISILILLFFEVFFQGPQREAQRAQQALIEATREAEAEASRAAAERTRVATTPPGASADREATRTTPDLRVRIDAPRVTGAINLTGARIDDLVLRDFAETTEPGSERVRLLHPRTSPTPYFAQFGWTVASEGRSVRVPDVTTAWNTSSSSLTPGSPVTLYWDNGDGQRFELIFAIDDNFMFRVEQRVLNSAAEPVQVTPWGRIRREHTPRTEGFYILHEGLIGVVGGQLREFTYSSARDEAKKEVEGRAPGTVFSQASTGGWAGITDKYWLTALIPDQSLEALMSFRHAPEGGQDRWQVDFLASPKEVRTGQANSASSHFFAGAKEVRLLGRYAAALGIPDFDSAVDWGWFWFLTKPIFFAIDYIFLVTGNFGVAILIFTLFVKLLFFPLANKSYKAMAKMKKLQPLMTELKAKFGEDSQGLQREMMALYKREKVNPVSGCLPVIIQIPVFFALYKVLVVTIEMRHAPFILWIRDLSAPDPTNIFTLFGLIPFDPTVLPMVGPFLHLGVFPLFMGVTMWLQQKLNPQPPDPIQAKVFAWMPVIFTFMLGSQPAGLVIYWAWNNLLSIAQQYLIMRRAGIPINPPAPPSSTSPPAPSS